jgi:hypothetical protein
VLTQRRWISLSERARLISEFQSEGVHIALPVDAGAIAMLASLEPAAGLRASQWVPIQVITINGAGGLLSGIVEDAGVFALLVLVTVESASAKAVRTYALTPAELLVVKMIGLIDHANPASHDRQPAAPSMQVASIQSAIESYAIAPGQWREKLRATIGVRR